MSIAIEQEAPEQEWKPLSAAVKSGRGRFGEHSVAATPSVRRRKVLLLDHTAEMGGGEIALFNLVRHLDRERYEPVVALFADGPLRTKLDEAGIETHVLVGDSGVLKTKKDTLGLRSLLRVRDVFRTLGFIWRLSRFIRSGDYDLVHTNSLKSDVIGGVAGRLARRPVIWHVRDRIAADYLPSLAVRVFRRLARLVPNYVIANSRATLQTLWLSPSHGGEAIPSGIELGSRVRVVHDGTIDALSRDADGITNLQPIIGLVGRISRWKGQHVFLKAAALVRHAFPNARFQIVGGPLFGEEAYEQEIRQLVDTLQLNNAVEMTGHRTDVQTLIAGMDILVHASISGEPFGQVVIEGMAAGKPVVATAGGGVPEIVVDGVTGLLVPMGDETSMAASISYLLSNPEVGRGMGRLAQGRVKEYFSIEGTASKVQAVYEQLLTPRSPERLAATVSAATTSAATASAPANGYVHPRGANVTHSSPTGWTPLVRYGFIVTVVGLGLLFRIWLQRSDESYGPMFPLLAAVAVAGWIGGLPGGLLATALSWLGHALLIRPWDPAHVLASATQTRVLSFVILALLVSALLELTHWKNRQLEKQRIIGDRERWRTAFLAKVVTSLNGSPDARTVFSKLAFFVCDGLADWCMVETIDDADGATRRAAVGHRSQADYAVVEQLMTFHSPADGPVATAIRGGLPVRSPPSRQPLTAGVTDPRHAKVVESLRCASYMVIPFTDRQCGRGAITLVSVDRIFDVDDLALASDIAWYATLAIGHVHKN